MTPASRVIVLLGVLGAGPARAGVSSFRLSEVATASSTDDPAARYVEVEATAAGCWFPSTQLVAYDAAGGVVGQAAPFASTTCFTAGRFLVFATPAGQTAFMTAADGALVPPLPPLAGQLCLVSSTTRYDCVRWGTITTPVHDLFAPADDTAAFGPPGGLALARHGDTGVVSFDWRVEGPSPGRANDGPPWDQGDAGLDAPPPDAPTDAAIEPDAEIEPDADAGPAADAPRDARPPDASTLYLDLDPTGGPCGCGAGGGATALIGVVLVAATVFRRRARS